MDEPDYNEAIKILEECKPTFVCSYHDIIKLHLNQ